MNFINTNIQPQKNLIASNFQNVNEQIIQSDFEKLNELNKRLRSSKIEMDNILKKTMDDKKNNTDLISKLMMLNPTCNTRGSLFDNKIKSCDTNYIYLQECKKILKNYITKNNLNNEFNENKYLKDLNFKTQEEIIEIKNIFNDSTFDFFNNISSNQEIQNKNQQNDITNSQTKIKIITVLTKNIQTNVLANAEDHSTSFSLNKFQRYKSSQQGKNMKFKKLNVNQDISKNDGLKYVENVLENYTNDDENMSGGGNDLFEFYLSQSKEYANMLMTITKEKIDKLDNCRAISEICKKIGNGINKKNIKNLFILLSKQLLNMNFESVSTPLIMSTISYLEQKFYEDIKLNENSRKIQKINEILKIKYQKMINKNRDLVDINMFSFWGVIFYFLRCGKYEEAIKFILENNEMIYKNNIRDNLSLPISDILSNKKIQKNIYDALESKLNEENLDKTNPYLHAVLVFLIKINKPLNNEILETFLDHLWLDLNLCIISEIKYDDTIDLNIMNLEDIQKKYNEGIVPNYDNNENLNCALILMATLQYGNLIKFLMTTKNYKEAIFLTFLLKQIDMLGNYVDNNNQMNIDIGEDATQIMDLFVDNYSKASGNSLILCFLLKYTIPNYINEISRLFLNTFNFSFLQNPFIKSPIHNISLENFLDKNEQSQILKDMVEKICGAEKSALRQDYNQLLYLLIDRSMYIEAIELLSKIFDYILINKRPNLYWANQDSIGMDYSVNFINRLYGRLLDYFNQEVEPINQLENKDPRKKSIIWPLSLLMKCAFIEDAYNTIQHNDVLKAGEILFNSCNLLINFGKMGEQDTIPKWAEDCVGYMNDSLLSILVDFYVVYYVILMNSFNVIDISRTQTNKEHQIRIKNILFVFESKINQNSRNNEIKERFTKAKEYVFNFNEMNGI